MNIGSLYLLTRAEWRAFFLGAREFRLSLTTSFASIDSSDAEWELQEAYDCGREFAHWVTFRRYED